MISKEAFALAFSLLPRAENLIGDSNADDRAQLTSAAAALAEERGVGEAFTAIAGELVAEGAPDAAARVAAYWAAVATFGVPPAVDRELGGPTDDELYSQKLELAANAEEAETERFYLEDYPAIAAARGESPENNPLWRQIVGVSASPARAVPEGKPLPPLDLDRRCDWPVAAIRSDYKRFMSSEERDLFNRSMALSEPFVADKIEAARYAMHHVIERRQKGRAA